MLELSLEPLLGRGELFLALQATPLAPGKRAFEMGVMQYPHVVLPGAARRRYRLSSVLAYLAATPERGGEARESLHRTRRKNA